MKQFLKLALPMLIALGLLSGCASVNKKFMASKSENLAPFADQTMSLVGEITRGYKPADMLYLRYYVDQIKDEEQTQRIFQLRAQANRLFRGIIAYSVQIVALAESNIEGNAKAVRLADFVQDLEKPVLEQSVIEINVTREEFETLLADMKAQEDLFKALAAAQPLINEAARYGGEIITEIQYALEKITNTVDQKIEERYAHIKQLVQTLEQEEKMATRGIMLLHQRNRQDREVITELKSLKLAGLSELLPPKKLTDQDVNRIEYFLISRLETNNKIINNIENTLTFYKETHVELDRVQKEKEAELRKARTFLILWSRAHLRMASGKVDPAEWYDVKQLPGQLLKAGTKVIF